MSEVEFSLFLVKKSLIDKADLSFKELMKWSDEDLFRRPLNFLFPADAHGRLDNLLEADDPRMNFVVFPQVPLRLKTGGYINFDMKMEQLADDARRLDFFKPGKAKGAGNGAANGEDGDSAGASDMYSFFNFVEVLLNSPYDGDMELTMISLDALKDGSGSALTEEQKNAVRADIEANLKKHAVGEQVGQLDEASYGLITSADFDEEAFQEELNAVAKRLKISPDAVEMRSAKVKIDDRDIDPEQLQRALKHSRGVFIGEIEGDDDELESLSNVLDGIEHNRKLIQDALEAKNFMCAPRLISDNIAAVSVALLQQGRVNLERRLMSPDRLVVLADHPDLSFAFDIAQLDRLVRQRVMKSKLEREKPDYYELCRSTILHADFAKALAALMEKHKEEPRLVGFRVLGLPPVKQGGPHWDGLNKLSSQGHPIWIDRFGDAVIDNEKLGCLKGGYIEMPPAMMRKLTDHFDGKDLMLKLIETWKKLNVQVMSCDLPDYDLKAMAQEIGITHALEDRPDEDEQ